MKSKLAAMFSLLLAASFLAVPASSDEVGFGGGTSFSPGAVFPFPAGIESSVETSFYVQNFGDVDLELELSYGTEPGITITPTEEQDTFLPSGSSTDFFFDIAVDPTVPPGKYPIIVNLRQANFEIPETGGSVYRPALAGQFTVAVLGNGASISVRAVSAFDGEPAVGDLTLYYVSGEETETKIFETTDSGFDRTLVPGSFRVTYDIPNLQRQELAFDVAAGESKEVIFEIPTLDFISVGAIPTRNDRDEVQLVSLSMNIFNNLRELDGPVEFLTRVYRNDEQIDEFAISTLPALPTGETLQRANYLSEEGFAAGDYEFRFFIKTSTFEVEAPRTVTFSNPDIVQNFLIQALVILGIIAFFIFMIPRKWWLLLFRRRKKEEEQEEEKPKNSLSLAMPDLKPKKSLGLAMPDLKPMKSFNFRMPRLKPKEKSREKPKAKTQSETSLTSSFSANRQWANSKEKPKPLEMPTPYPAPAKTGIDQEQLDQAIQKAVLKALANAASETESVAKSQTKKKQSSTSNTKEKPKTTKAASSRPKGRSEN